MSDRGAWLDVGAATKLGHRQLPHHLQQRAYVDRDRGVLAVIRGYGGQSTGDLAVTMVAEELDRALAVGADARAAVAKALAAASARLQAPPPHPYSGGRTASVTALVVAPPRATVFHIGNGRAYLLRMFALRRLTVDHTLDVAVLPRPILSRALGHLHDDRPDEIELTVDSGDRYLVVNDTVAAAITEPEIREIALASAAQSAAARLVARTYERDLGRSATAAVAMIRRGRERL